MENFGIITMWYVIEHFRDLKIILTKVNRMLEHGGIFAFSTPNGSGISSKRDLNAFLKNSPDDHYTLWEPETSAAVLSQCL